MTDAGDLRVLIVSGIWPPDVGGPASHGPGLGAFLAGRGHAVSALISADGAPEDPGFPVEVVDRRRPLPVRMADGAVALARAVRAADVVYATGIYHRTALAARAARVPLVLKLVNDPAYERARSRGWYDGTLEDFQEHRRGGDRRVDALRRARDVALRSASHLIVPSAYLARIVEGWGLGVPVTVVHNPAVVAPATEPRETLRAQRGLDGMTAVFAGRFVVQKNLPMAVDAMRDVEGLRLHLVGDGPERPALQAALAAAGMGDRVALVPPVPQAEAGRWMRAGDVTVLPSDWENFPHAAVESLAQGTPVIATAVGGVPEIVQDDVNGWLLRPGDRAGLVAALRRFVTDEPARERLRAGAAATGDRFAPARLFAAAEDLLRDVSRRR